MFKNFKIITITLLLVTCSLSGFSLPCSAEQHNSIACNHKTGDCFDADAVLDFGYVTIYFKDGKTKTLDIDDDYPDDLTAYDKEERVYYDIEFITRPD